VILVNGDRVKRFWIDEILIVDKIINDYVRVYDINNNLQSYYINDLILLDK
jgi:hypothetical protein